jgi:succinate dehydrogenase/fumarate reductase flavoprotein subunit
LIEAELTTPELKLVRETPHMDFVPGFQTADRPAREAWVAGRAIIGGLWKAAVDRKVDYHLSSAVRGLIVERGRVVGIKVEHSDGKREEVHARRGVLLNTGGFDWNREFASRYLPGPPVLPQTPPSNTGDGHIMAMELGAATALMDKAIWHPSILIPGDTQDDGSPLYRMFNAELSKPHCMVVNRTGARFAPESTYFALAESWFELDSRSRSYRNVPSYFIADEEYRERYGLPGVPAGASVPDWITVADSLSGIAEALGVDEPGLLREVETYNRDCETGTDTRFARGTFIYERFWGDPDQQPNPTMGAISRPPFYAFPLHLTHAGSRGGVVQTPDGEVLRVDGSTIPGLYACGNTAANSLFGGGYGSGAAVGSSVVFGHLAALHAARS